MIRLQYISLLLVCFVPAGKCRGGHFSGNLSSPNYPHPYPHDKVVSWTLTAPSTAKGFIQLCFNDFMTEKHYDSLTVYTAKTNPISVGSHPLYRFSGSGPRFRCLPTQDRNVTLIFRSDSILALRGFQLEYDMTPDNDTGIPFPLGELKYYNLALKSYSLVRVQDHVGGFIKLHLGASPLEVFFSQLLIYQVHVHDNQLWKRSLVQRIKLDAARSFPKYIYTRARFLLMMATVRRLQSDWNVGRSQIRLPWATYFSPKDTMVVSCNREIRLSTNQSSKQMIPEAANMNGSSPVWWFFRSTWHLMSSWRNHSNMRYEEEILRTDRRYSSESGCIRVTFQISWPLSGPGGLELIYRSTSIPGLWQVAWQSPLGDTYYNQKRSVDIFSNDVVVAFRCTWGGMFGVRQISISDCNYPCMTRTTSTTSTTTTATLPSSTPPIFAVYTSSYGTLKSPGYPSEYPRLSNRRWKIISKLQITLIFRQFDTEHNYDILGVYDCENIYSSCHLLGSFSGRMDANYELPCNSSIVELRFHSDSYLQKTGFIIDWRPSSTTTTRQSPTISADVSIFRSPGYPNSYPVRKTMSWVFQKDSEIYLLFEDFDTEKHIDKLMVYELDSRKNRVLLRTYSGQVTRNECYATGSSHVELLFITGYEKKNGYRGFQIKCSTTRPPSCAGLSSGQTVGLSIGVVLGFVCIVGAVVSACRQRKRRTTDDTRTRPGRSVQYTNGMDEPRVALTNFVSVSVRREQGLNGPSQLGEDNVRSDAPPRYNDFHLYSTVQSINPPTYEELQVTLNNYPMNKPQDVVPPPPAYSELVPPTQTDHYVSRSDQSEGNGYSSVTTVAANCASRDLAAQGDRPLGLGVDVSVTLASSTPYSEYV